MDAQLVDSLCLVASKGHVTLSRTGSLAVGIDSKSLDHDTAARGATALCILHVLLVRYGLVAPRSRASCVPDSSRRRGLSVVVVVGVAVSKRHAHSDTDEDHASEREVDSEME
jgi:hypothetical protein